MIKNGIKIVSSKVLILGFTFKENCADTRNTKVIDIYKELGEYGIMPVVVDPEADAEEAEKLYGITFDKIEDILDMNIKDSTFSDLAAYVEELRLMAIQETNKKLKGKIWGSYYKVFNSFTSPVDLYYDGIFIVS